MMLPNAKTPKQEPRPLSLVGKSVHARFMNAPEVVS
jgi:hypothetical protein